MTAAQENVPPAGQDREPLPPAGPCAGPLRGPFTIRRGDGEAHGTSPSFLFACRVALHDVCAVEDADGTVVADYRYEAVNDKPESPPASSDRGSSTLDGVAQFLILFALFALLLVAFDIGIERQADWMAEQYGRAETID